MAGIRFRTPVWQSQLPSRQCTDLVVALVPSSAEAQAALTTGHNRRLLQQIKESTPKISLGSKLSSASCYAKISFATFLGRRAICIGSSRSAEVMLPQSASVADRHLLIHFDLQDAGILLTDNSSMGTWIRTSPMAQWQLLHKTTWPLSQNIEVRFGLDPELHFLLAVETYTSAVLQFETLYQEHIQSLYTAIRWLPGCNKRRSSSYLQIDRKRRFAVHN